MRVQLSAPPFAEHHNRASWNLRGAWPCAWVSCPGARGGSTVCAYRLRFRMPRRATVRVHVSADQRYELFLDGVRIGRGPERGDPMHWYYETHALTLAAGRHVLVARVWWLSLDDGIAPAAQMSVKPGFLLAADAPFTALLSTGRATWDTKPLGGYTFHRVLDHDAGELAGGTHDLDGEKFPWGFERGAGGGWRPAPRREPASDAIDNTTYGTATGPRLRPATLPAMLDRAQAPGIVRFIEDPGAGNPRGRRVRQAHHLAAEAPAWQAFCAGRHALRIPPHSRRRVILDLAGYSCVYPELRVSGGRGSRVRLGFSEALWLEDPPRNKGQRDELEGKLFIGRWHAFRPDGGPRRSFTTLWWSCGRYLEITVRTAAQALTLHAIELRETRYPLELESGVQLSEERFNRAVPLMHRTLQVCAHETYFDCPYYEQLMYGGDTRVEILTTYATTRDDRLPRKALTLFQASQRADGLTQSRYPCSRPQVIPQFSLYWVAMVHDFALWRGDRDFVRGLMPGVRGVIEAFLAAVRPDGLLRVPEGWNWVDWVPAWRAEIGAPALDLAGLSGINNLQLVMVLGHAAALERWAGEPALAARLDTARTRLMGRITDVFWDEGRGLFADTPARHAFSEHAQCFALLAGLLPARRRRRVAAGLLRDPDLARATIYFRHYLFDAFHLLARTDEILNRLDLWYELPAMGLKTCIEQPEPSRSDCHAWGAHPIYHAFASILGVRPAAYGFDRVRIAPDLGALPWARGKLVHPRGGHIAVDLKREGRTYVGSITLPRGLSGVFVHGAREIRLRPGRQRISA